MENRPTSKVQRILRGMRFPVAWGAIVTLCAAYGSFRFSGNGTQDSVEGAVLFGGFGVGLATWVLCALFELQKFLAGHIRAWSATLLYVLTSGFAVITTPFATVMARNFFSPEILGGERAMAIPMVGAWMAFAAAGGFVFFGTVVVVTLVSRAVQRAQSDH
jgi:hypothetical protein